MAGRMAKAIGTLHATCLFDRKAAPGLWADGQSSGNKWRGFLAARKSPKISKLCSCARIEGTGTGSQVSWDCHSLNSLALLSICVWHMLR